MEYSESPPSPYATAVALSQGGYDYKSAIADIVDNSVTAKAENIWIQIATTNDDNPIVRIWDDGYGMDQRSLANAMKYGSEDSSGLGRFGMGLKSASTSMADCLNVFSRKGRDEDLRIANWDMERIKESGWRLGQGIATDAQKEIFERYIQASGTLVEWQNIKGLGKPGTFTAHKKGIVVRYLREHLALVFHRFLNHENRPRKIFINDEEVKGWNPIPVDEPDCELDLIKTIDMTDEEGNTHQMVLRCYLLPGKLSWTSDDEKSKYKMNQAVKYQGLYVYREDRTITSGDWLDLVSKEPHLNLCRFELDIPRELDTILELNYQKTKVVIEEGIAQVLDRIWKPSRIKGQEKYRDTNRRTGMQDPAPDHAQSSRAISAVESSISTSDVERVDEHTTRVNTTDSSYIVETVQTPREVLVDPIESEAIWLWKPTYREGDKVAVQLNKSHEYYQRVYRRFQDSRPMINALDMVFWSLADLCYGRI